MKKLNHILITIILSVAIFNSYAQNLVPNPSFEIYSSCPTNLTYLYYASPWFQPSTYYGTTTATCSSDLFNNCIGSSSSSPGVPINYLGTQGARTGNGYAGFFVYADTINTREYIETSLLSPLISGGKYCVEFYVSLADNSDIAISNIGSYFSLDSLLDTTYHAISYCIPQIENSTILDNKVGWTLVSGFYIATGGERYITIGNFHTPSTTTFQNVTGGTPWSRAYYYIDDISVVRCDSANSISETNLASHIKLYPNPNSGSMTLEYYLASTDIATLEITDVTGKIIDRYQLSSASNVLKLTEEELKNGIYIYHIIVNGKIIKSDKLLIIK